MSEKKKQQIIPKNIDEAISQFQKARNDRIIVRRERIADKMAERKEAEERERAEREYPQRKSRKTAVATTIQKKKGKKVKDEGNNQKTSAADQLDAKIDESRKALEQVILDGDALITNVRVAVEYREKVRQNKSDENKKDRLERLHKEAEESQQIFDDLSKNWDMKMEKMLPVDMYKQMKTQQDACNELLEKKDDVIRALRREIEENDFEYDELLEKYQKDTMLIGDRIDDLVTELRNAFLQELNTLEQFATENQASVLDEYQAEWMDLLKKFDELERKNLEERKADAIARFKLLNELMMSTKEESRELRHKMEDDLRTLILEREQIKYSCHMNLEKLAYNLHILKCRSKENLELKNMLKRFVLQLHDKLDHRSKGLERKMETGRKMTEKLMREIQRLENQTLTCSQKTLQLAKAEQNKYVDLWETNEEIIREKMQTLLDSEKFVYETQLDIEYPTPDFKVFDKRPPLVASVLTKRGKIKATSTEQQLVTTYNDDEDTYSVMDSQKTETPTANKTNKSQLQGVTGEGVVECKRQPSIVINPTRSLEFIPGPEPDLKVQRRLMKGIAKVICDQSGFILEDELKKILGPLAEKERNLVTLDAVMHALGISNIDEMQALSRYMLRYCTVMQGVMSRIGTDESAKVTEMNISMEGVLGKAYIEDATSETVTMTLNEYKSGMENSTTPSYDCDVSPDEYCSCKMGNNEQLEMESMKEDEDELTEDKEHKTRLSAAEDSAKKAAPTSTSKATKNNLEKQGKGKKSKNTSRRQKSENDSTIIPCSPLCCTPPSSGERLEQTIGEMQTDEDLEMELEMDKKDPQGDIRELNYAGSAATCSFSSNKATVLSWLEDGEREKIVERLEKYRPRREEEDDEDRYDDAFQNTLAIIDDRKGLTTTNNFNKSQNPNGGSDLRIWDETDPSSPESVASIDTHSDATEEFMYIQPEQVVTALRNFVEDYNNKQKIVVPTLEEIIAKKLQAIKFPSFVEVGLYWEEILDMIGSKGLDLWESVRYCFEQYSCLLRERNNLVLEIQKHYQQNYELSHLLQKHFQSTSSYCAPQGGWTMDAMDYCNDQC